MQMTRQILPSVQICLQGWGGEWGRAILWTCLQQPLLRPLKKQMKDDDLRFATLERANFRGLVPPCCLESRRTKSNHHFWNIGSVTAFRVRNIHWLTLMHCPALDEYSSKFPSNQALPIEQPQEHEFQTHTPKRVAWSKEELQAFSAPWGAASMKIRQLDRICLFSLIHKAGGESP